MRKIFRKAPRIEETPWRSEWTPQGVLIARSNAGTALTDPLLPAYLAQLEDDGHSIETDGGMLIEWAALYEALDNPGYSGLSTALGLPPLTAARPVLCSSGSLIDRDFSISLAGWDSDSGSCRDMDRVGAILRRDGQTELMRPEHWRLIDDVRRFAGRSPDERGDLAHRQAWGRIRKLGLAANARFDDFLYRSVVLTPEKLEIGLRRSATVTDDSVIEIEPQFAGVPTDWLARFDRERRVLDRYDFATPEGIVQVVIEPRVKTVLQEIKRLPLRRVAGARAQAFILNPFATLGEDAADVIVEEQFEQARAAAGLHYERFNPLIERDADPRQDRIGLLIEAATSEGPVSSKVRWLGDQELTGFVRKLESALQRGFPLLGWEGYDLELQGDAHEHLATLKDALERRSRPPPAITYAEVHNLDEYSSRIEGIGIEKPYYSACIARRDDAEGWFPDNVDALITWPGTDHGTSDSVPVTPQAIEELEHAVKTAHAAGLHTVDISWLPGPMPLREAEGITQLITSALEKIGKRTFEAPQREQTLEGRVPKKSLILRSNIQRLDYEERRREALQEPPGAPELPESLLPDYPLLPHQRDGVAWLQHLHRAQAEHQVKGAVLADDMGLGKTLQLLTFIAWLLERDPHLDPVLVVAPISLLENWQNEATKFFRAGTFRILLAHGDSLRRWRVPRAEVDDRLRTEDGLVRFLRSGWVGPASLVLTTYETLRDLEFSFAAQPWSVMVCDEAQRIKNPAAMVTRAAKKQKAAFRVACTGTPVENTLADLWCLFDFVQPGLLGALEEFGSRDRRPIEARSDEERARAEELRERIRPQILRRLKTEVARDLPPKIVVEDCRRLPLSAAQRSLYAQAITHFRGRDEGDLSSPFSNPLGLLHYLRLICTDPRQHGRDAVLPESLDDYRAKSPKLDWLLKQLLSIRERGEKAIIFCEFRDIQRLLQHYIDASFGFRPDVLNGDTPASAAYADSRQKRIDAFQQQPGFGVIVLSPFAVGFGLNIQAANHVIHYMRTWNPAKEDQATDRAYRIGQKKDVHVYYPVVRADDFTTFDVKLDQLLESKRALAADMLNGTGDIAPGAFDIDDIAPT